jgi:hypothetical protein
MAKLGVWIATFPESATALHRQNTREGDAGCVASVSHHRVLFFPYIGEADG